ncbi:MAG: tRNA pseudouridine(38-40) synthase TruA [Bacteriovoracaceae bacterium]|nr:tRNA pseudouridine(38-40) synthase TruA [Bacteriovoracaceae bacterium]
MSTFKIKLAYKGTNYCGWQIQAQGEKTIQGALNSALASISKCNISQVSTLASGRTDSGVHSLGQIVKVTTPLEISKEALLRALNSHLDSDIRVLEVEAASENFHPIRDSLWKEYIYVFSNLKQSAPFCSDMIHNHPSTIDIELMHEASKQFVGHHDFSNFYCVGSDVLTYERTIYECDLTFKQSDGFWQAVTPSYYNFRVRGNGFLKQMVRLMMGTLWAIGKGHVPISKLQQSLSGLDTGKLGDVAPACGLYLSKVKY